MKVIKSINNNVAICQDSTGEEVVVFGKGVGFRKPPYDISPAQIERTYYGVDSIYLSMINELPEEIIEIATEIVRKARNELNNPFSSNIVFTLADHINFTIQRYLKKMNVKLPIVNDVQYLFEKETQLGKYGIQLIREKLKIRLPEEEGVYIALHLINAEEREENSKTIENDKLIEDIVRIIEKEYGIQIKKENFNYSRFVSHMYYLLKRSENKNMVKSTNNELYKTVKQDFPETYICEEKISSYLNDKLKILLTEEEKLYLMLHINRLCSREDCYQ